MATIGEVRALAAGAAARFVVKTREDGSTFTTVPDGPGSEWVRDAVMAAHGDAWPNDRIFDTCHAALLAIGEGNDDEITDGYGSDFSDVGFGFADGQVSVYTGDRLRWLAEAPGALDACNGAADEGLINPGEGLEDRIAAGWCEWNRAIFNVMLGAVEARVDGVAS